MFNDEQIQEWIENHGQATSFTFIIYGEPNDEELDIIIKGLIIFLQLPEDYLGKVAIFNDPIIEEQAIAWDVYRGTSLCFVFAGDFKKKEDIVKKLVLDGLDYLRYKCEYLGMYSSESYV